MMVTVKAVLKKWGNGQGIQLSQSVLEEACFTKNEVVEITADNTGIHVRKADKAITIDELFAEYEGGSQPSEFDTGKPVGHEVL